MENELVTIIIPVYKVERYLDKCVKSVVSQTYQNLEIILVDDGSPDASPDICDRWAQLDARIKVVHKKNGGLSDARNAGLDHMSGKWVIFIDSDDYVHKQYVEVLYYGAKKYNIDVVMADFRRVHENEKNLTSSIDLSSLRYEIKNKKQIFSIIFKKYMTAWGKIYRAEIWENLSFKIGKIHEDEFAITDIFLKARNFAIVHEKLYYYLQRQGSIMSRRTFQADCDKLEAYAYRLMKFKDYFPEKKYERKILFVSIKLRLTFFFRWLKNYKNDKRFKWELKYVKKLIKALFISS